MPAHVPVKGFASGAREDSAHEHALNGGAAGAALQLLQHSLHLALDDAVLACL